MRKIRRRLKKKILIIGIVLFITLLISVSFVGYYLYKKEESVDWKGGLLD